MVWGNYAALLHVSNHLQQKLIDYDWLAHYLRSVSEHSYHQGPYAEETQKGEWRVKTNLQASYPLLTLLQNSVF